MKLFSSCLCLIVTLCFFPAFSSGQQIHRDRSVQVYERAAILRSRLTVLSISLQPGYEDLRALAYMRFVRGAKIVSAYLTNGESGHGDVQAFLPGELAFNKRAEAFQALSQLGGSEYFFNFADNGSANDRETVTTWWEPDSLRSKIVSLIEVIRPDMIILPPDRQEQSEISYRWDHLKDVVLEAVDEAGRGRTASGFVRPTAWRVRRVVSASKHGSSVRFSDNQKAGLHNVTCDQMAEEIGKTYRSMYRQRMVWRQRPVDYEIDVPKGLTNVTVPDESLPGGVEGDFHWIESEVGKLSTYAMKAAMEEAIDSRRKIMLNWIAIVMDSVDTRLSRWNAYSNMMRKTLLHWKEGLEELRNAVFGVHVSFTLKDTVLIGRQLTSLRVNEVQGMDAKGNAELFFPDVGKRWILNESTEPRIPLVVGQEYRLISPPEDDVALPAVDGGRGLAIHGSNLEFFVIYHTDSRSERFFKKVSQRILFAPKLTVEPLTPLVRVTDGEFVAFRFINHSNDGLLDTVAVRDSLATSPPHVLRLPSKEATVIDTLQLSWREAIGEGTYRVPLSIGSAVGGYFAAREFEVEVDSSRQMGIVASLQASPLTESLRRLGVHPVLITREDMRPLTLSSLDVIVFDERLFLLQPWIVDSLRSFQDFVTVGGTLVVLSQEANSWNQSLFSSVVQLTSTSRLGPELDVEQDSLHSLGNHPNVLSEVDWSGWLFSRSENFATVEETMSTVPIRFGEENTPGVIVQPAGRGKIIYVNLALGHQFANIHPGALRLLSNLLSQ